MKLLTHQIETDYYKILGLNRNASIRDIKKAFRRLSKLYHPDTGANDAVMFHKLQEAYEVLIDPQKRFLYDTVGFSKEELNECAKTITIIIMEEIIKGGKATDKHLQKTIKDVCNKAISSLVKNIISMESAADKMEETFQKVIGKNDKFFNELVRETMESFIANNRREVCVYKKEKKRYETVIELAKHIDFLQKEPDIDPCFTTMKIIGNSRVNPGGTFTIRFG